jgi:hypothetical protein
MLRALGIAAVVRRSNFTRQWKKVTNAAGLSGFHFHDLRHTGNTLAGEAGVTLRELMDRMGHASTRAALIYQHRITHRDKLIAGDQQARRGRTQAIEHATGTRQEDALMTATLMISKNTALPARSLLERMTGIEPALSAWESERPSLQLGRDLRIHGSPSDREYLLTTGINGTLMAGRLRGVGGWTLADVRVADAAADASTGGVYWDGDV